MVTFMFASAVVGIFLVIAFIIWSGFAFVTFWQDQRGWAYYKGLLDECELLIEYYEKDLNKIHTTNNIVSMLELLKQRRLESFLNKNK